MGNPSKWGTHYEGAIHVNHMGKCWYKIFLKPGVRNVSDRVMLINVSLHMSIKYEFLVMMEPKGTGLKRNHN